MRRALRVVGWTFLSLVMVFLALCSAGEIRQRVLVHRAKALMVDIQSLKDQKSTWADAQRLMTKWGKWGRYEGSCTAADCMYTVALRPPPFQGTKGLPMWLDRIWYVARTLRLLPRQVFGELTEFDGMFLIQDGVVRRKGLSIWVEASPLAKGKPESCCGYALIESVVERSSLKLDTLRAFWDDEQSRHPDYTVWRPGGCTFCLMGRAQLAASSDSRFRDLTQFRLNCLLRWSSCLTLEQLNPGAKPWELYGPPWGEAPERADPKSTDTATCGIPVYARARDAAYVVLMEAVKSSLPVTTPEGNPRYTTTTVRVIATEDGRPGFEKGQVLQLRTIGSVSMNGAPVSFSKGDWFLLMLRDGFELDKDVPIYESPAPCEIARWSVETEEQVLRGIAMRDSIRGNEPNVGLGGFSRDAAHSNDF